jgi:hypothetical protein
METLAHCAVAFFVLLGVVLVIRQMYSDPSKYRRAKRKQKCLRRFLKWNRKS